MHRKEKKCSYSYALFFPDCFTAPMVYFKSQLIIMHFFDIHFKYVIFKMV